MKSRAPHPARARIQRVGLTTERELAQLAQTSQTAISLWINGRRGLSKDVARRVSAILHVPIETVLYDWSPPAEGSRRRRKRVAR